MASASLLTICYLNMVIYGTKKVAARSGDLDKCKKRSTDTYSRFFPSIEIPPGPKLRSRIRPPRMDMSWKKTYR